MNGKLGAIYIREKQVGGFLDWTFRLNLADGVDGTDKTFKVKSWKITAWAHWLHQMLGPGDKVRVKLCSDEAPGFWEGECAIASQPTQQLETLAHVRIEFLGVGELTAGAVADEVASG